jgi:putative transposase
MDNSRRTSFNDPGHAHFLTFGCFRHQQILTDEQACQLLAESINRARQRHNFALWAYVFMPDHVHLLIWPRSQDYSISEILRSIKGWFARSLLAEWRKHHPRRLKHLEVRTSRGIQHRVWQRGGGYDRNLHNLDTVRRAIKYIEYNPVRKRFVAEPSDWKWSSAQARLGKQDVPLDIDALP